jgi:hypothetical protein
LWKSWRVLLMQHYKSLGAAQSNSMTWWLCKKTPFSKDPYTGRYLLSGIFFVNLLIGKLRGALYVCALGQETRSP